MRKREGYKSGIELLQGTLDMLILQTLRRGPQNHRNLYSLPRRALQVERHPKIAVVEAAYGSPHTL
jgi:hypothetical protein